MELQGSFVAFDSPENHVFPAQAGIHREAQWVPAFAGTTLMFIGWGEQQAHDNYSGRHATRVLARLPRGEEGGERSERGEGLVRGSSIPIWLRN